MIALGAAALVAIAVVVVIGAVVHRPSQRPLVMTAGSTSSTTGARAGGGVGAGASGAGGAGAGAEAAEVQQLVASVRRPPGATPLGSCPTVAAEPIKPLPRTTAATDSRCWSVPDPLNGTMRWERRHHPAHMEAAGSVRTGSVRSPVARGLLYRLGREGGVELSVYPSGNGTVMRVDGYVRAPTPTVSNVG